MDSAQTIRKAIQAVTACTHDELATLLDKNPDVHGQITLELVFVHGRFDRIKVGREYGIKMEKPEKK